MFGKKEPVKNGCPLFCLLNTTIYPQTGLKLLKAMQKMPGDKNLAAFHHKLGCGSIKLITALLVL